MLQWLTCVPSWHTLSRALLHWCSQFQDACLAPFIQITAELNRLITQMASRHEHITLILREMHWLLVQYETEFKPTCSNTAWHCITVSIRWIPASVRHRLQIMVIWHFHVRYATDQKSAGWHCCRSTHVEYVASFAGLGWLKRTWCLLKAHLLYKGCSA